MIHSSADGAVRTIELRRPERRNALALELCAAIHAALGDAVGNGTRVATAERRAPVFRGR